MAYTLSMSATQGSLATPTKHLVFKLFGPGLTDKLKLLISQLCDTTLGYFEELQVSYD